MQKFPINSSNGCKNLFLGFVVFFGYFLVTSQISQIEESRAEAFYEEYSTPDDLKHDAPSALRESR